jgi:hypothetical protein
VINTPRATLHVWHGKKRTSHLSLAPRALRPTDERSVVQNRFSRVSPQFVAAMAVSFDRIPVRLVKGRVSMKTIHCWDDLRPYGVVVLTGEACGLSYRILCDVTAAGKKVIEKALDVAGLDLRENWNTGPEEDPHVGSIMLAPELMVPVGAFALLENGCSEVWLTKGQSLVGLESEDTSRVVENFRQVYAENLARRFAYRGTAGDRNVHTMTGRVV